MYKIIKDGATIGMTEAPNYIRQHENGCFVLCPEPEASGITFGGTPYNLIGRETMEGVDSVMLEETDAGREISEAKDSTIRSAKMTGQLQAAAKQYVQTATNITDDDALTMPDLFKTWDEVLLAGKELPKDSILNLNGQLYRVVQSVTPQEHQRPDGEGMTAIYRPIDKTHAGTEEDPIPWVYGMDSEQGKYYSFSGKVYLCNLTMPGCIYQPGSPGLWQWSEVDA